MNTENLYYLVNSFDVVTQKSYKQMKAIASDHFVKLTAAKNEYDLSGLVQRFEPLYKSYCEKYSLWITSKETLRVETIGIQNIIKDLDDKIMLWNIQIHKTFSANLPDVNILFPDREQTFSVESTINYVETLKGVIYCLGNYPKLENIKKEAETCLFSLDQNLRKQMEAEEVADRISQSLESTRKELSIMLFRNLGALIDRLGGDPFKAISLFETKEFKFITSMETEPVVGRISPGQIMAVDDRTITDNTEFRIMNIGKAALKFWTDTFPFSKDSFYGIEIAPGAKKTVCSTDIGKSGSKVLIVRNLDSKTHGIFSVR